MGPHADSHRERPKVSSFANGDSSDHMVFHLCKHVLFRVKGLIESFRTVLIDMRL